MTTDQVLDDFAMAGQAEEEAAAATGKFNFGKLTLKARFLAWAEGQPTEVTAAVYGSLGPRQRSLEYVFQVDVQEFKPDLNFTYERKVGVGSLDWNKILKPSLEAVFGAGSTEKDHLATTLRKLHGAYVCVEDVPQTPTRNKPDRSKYNTIKLVTLYETREACFAAWREKYGSAQASGAPIADVPPGYTGDTWAKQKDDIAKLRQAYLGKGNPPAKATELAAAEYGASALQVAKLLNVAYGEFIPF